MVHLKVKLKVNLFFNENVFLFFFITNYIILKNNLNLKKVRRVAVATNGNKLSLK